MEPLALDAAPGYTCGMKSKARLFCICLFALILGCGHQPIDRNAALSNLKTEIEKLRQALLHEDQSAVADLSCPSLVKMLGGRDEFIARLSTIAAELKGRGFHIDSIDASESLSYVESSNNLYSVVPQTVHLSSPLGTQISKRSYLVGVSADGGATWKFLDGQGIGGDRKKMEMVLPSFPKDLALPEVSKAEGE